MNKIKNEYLSTFNDVLKITIMTQKRQHDLHRKCFHQTRVHIYIYIIAVTDKEIRNKKRSKTPLTMK